MTDRVIERICARLDALGLSKSGTEVKRMLADEGLSQTYINDVVTGRVRQPRHGNLEKVAKILKCPISYLLGEDADDQAAAVIDGICAVGARHEPPQSIAVTVAMKPEAGHPWNRQSVFLVRGDDYKSANISDGCIVFAAHGVAAERGDAVVARFDRTEGGVEITILVANGDGGYLKFGKTETSIVKTGFEVIGKIIKTYSVL